MILLSPKLCLFSEKNYFLNFCVYLSLGKLVNRNHFPVKEKFGFQESVFLKNLGGKHFPEVVKNLKILYYLLIISNLVLKLLIVIYILFWIFIFQFHLFKFNFYINFGLYFYNCYLFFPYFFYWNFLCIKFDPNSFDCYLFYLK